MQLYNISSYPKQKISDSQKTVDWQKACVKYFCDIVLSDLGSVRKTKAAMNDNYNIVMGKIRRNEIEKVNNPLKLEGDENNIPPVWEDTVSIINPIIKTLTGEEFRRDINWKVEVVNPEAVSKKEEMLKSQLMERFTNLMDLNLTDEQVQAQSEKLKDWMLYEYQDIRERRASHLLNYYWEQLKLRYLFNEGFKDALIAGEETYRIDLIGLEPRVVRCNPLSVYTVRNSESPRLEDADGIIEDVYMTPGQIMDNFGDVLTPKQIDEIYDHSTNSWNQSGVFNAPHVAYSQDVDPDYRSFMQDYEDPSYNYGNYRRVFKNAYGEFRVLRIYWKSLRELKIHTYIDPDTGNEIKELLDGNIKLKADPTKGESYESTWVTEWWQGIRIGASIFIEMKPCEMQFRDINNPYISYPPYIGTIYNVNDRAVRSLVDELKPIQTEWTVHKLKLNLLLMRNLGKLVEIDVSKIPSFGDDATKNMDIFINHLKIDGIVYTNPFEEGGKGQMAGAYSSALRAVDVDMSSMIKNELEYLAWLQEWADLTSGVGKQRRGEGAASEGLGVTQERIVRQTHQTEDMFSRHDYLKIRVLERLLEVCKYSLKQGNKKMDYILDTLDVSLMDFPEDDFKDADFGIKVVSSSKVMELQQKITTYAEYALNNGMALADVIDVEMTPSLSDKVAKLKKAERNRVEQSQEAQKSQMQMQKENQQLQRENLQLQLNAQLEVAKIKAEAMIEVEKIRSASGIHQGYLNNMEDTNHNFIDDNVEIKMQQMINDSKDKDRQFEREKVDKQVKAEIEKARIAHDAKIATKNK